MIQAERGNGAAMHAHETEEVFMPLIGNWAVSWMTKNGEKEIVLEQAEKAGLARDATGELVLK